MNDLRLKGTLSKDEVTFSADEIIFLEGDSSDSFYIISTGKVRTFKEKNKKLLPISICGPADIIGEGPVFADTKNTLTAVCIEPVLAFKVKSADVKSVLKNSPDWVGNIMVTLADRLADLYSLVEEHEILADMSEETLELTPKEEAHFRNIFDKHKSGQ